MAREMIEPTEALDKLAEHFIRPQSRIIGAIVSEILGPSAPPDLIMRCVMSVVGQVLFYHHCRPAICRVFPQQEYAPCDLENLADHITEFSFAAMRNLNRESQVHRREAARGPGGITT